VLSSLFATADKVLVGGAMAHPFLVAKKLSIGKSFIDKKDVPLAKRLLKNKKLILPIDVVVSSKLDEKARARVVPVGSVNKTDQIGDIGTDTMMAWAAVIKSAKTVIWNGPVGVTEIKKFSHGSLVVARAIAARSKGPAYGVVGGGDTLPVMLETGMSEWVDHLSTGGGAMLEFIAEKGKLPGLEALKSRKSVKSKT
jgi:phosphoglycerate kinase